jgi:hypothetical protein
MSKSFTTQEYKEICSNLHNYFYDYSLLEYRNQFSVLTIICPKHGAFQQRAANHIVGKGCRDCAKESRPIVKQRNAAKKFIVAAKLVYKHRNRNYSYDKVEYKGARENVTVTCMEHGDFYVTPNNHLRGRGCPHCAKTGYNRNAKGFLYILQCDNITKVGITNNKPEHRCTKVSRSFGKRFSVLWQQEFQVGATADYIETVLLQELSLTYRKPDFKFDGSTECFYDVDIPTLLALIEELIASQTAAQAA